MHIKRSRVTAVMTLILSILALSASLAGVMDKNLYGKVLEAGTITRFLVSGSIAQDIISIPLGLLLAILSVLFLKRAGEKTFIAILGLSGYFFYGYGLYAMQGQYTSIYHVYLAIFALAIYSLIFGLLSFEYETVKQYALPKALSKAIAIFLLMIIVVLTPLWLVFSTQDIVKHIPRDAYAVFVLDLGIVFPALAMTAVMLLRNKPFGNILTGVALLKALTVCLSVAFGELFQALYGGLKPNYGGIIIFSALTVINFVLFVLYMSKLRKGELANG